jgi:hypothetical protein
VLPRLTLTLIVALSLSLAYKLYSEIVTPLVQPQHHPVSPEVLMAEPAVRQGPREHAEMATRYLPESPWAQSAKIKFRHENMYFFCGQWQQSETGSMSFAPFAVIFKNETTDDGERYYSLEAEQAVLRFDGNVDLTNFNPELLSRAVLNGKVHIKGPDNLEVIGETFEFEKNAQHVRSDFPVEFRYEEHFGRAKNIELTLIPKDEFNPNPQLAFKGVKDVSLMNDVELSLKIDEKQPHAIVKCLGRLSYDFAQKRAILSDTVQLRSQPYPGEFDTMTCDRMALDLSETPKDTTRKLTAEEKERRAMPLKRFFAEGNNVVLTSDHQKMRAEMQEVEYVAAEHHLSLTSAQLVRVVMEGTEVLCPSIQLWTNEKHDLTEALADGAGWIRHFDKNVEVAKASWGQQMHLEVDPTMFDRQTGRPWDRIEMTGRASLQHTAQQAGLIAETIRFWIDRQPAPASPTGQTNRNPSAAVSQIRLKRLQADKAVKLLSAQVGGEMELLELDFVEENFIPVSVAQARARNRVQPVGYQDPGAPPKEDDKLSGPLVRKPISVETQHLVGKVRVNPLLYATGDQRPQIPQQELVDLSEAYGIGHVVIKQDQSLESAAWSIGGDRLHVVNDGANEQKITLYGQPAIIEHNAVHLEGPEIIFERDLNRATVKGQAVVRMPVKMNLSGEELPQEQMMTVNCYEQLVFDGQVGRFQGKVRAYLADGLLQCGELQVHLDQKINFSERLPEGKKIKLHQVFCKEHVSIDLHQYEKSQLTGVIKGELSEIGLNYSTGDLVGYGKGQIHAWSFSPPKDEQSQQQNGGTASLAPKRDPSKQWTYLKMDFDGKFEGNINEKRGTVSQRVRCLYGPVIKALVPINRDELPDDAGTLNCNLISGRLTTDEWNGPYEVTAEDNVELAGNLFMAMSDELTYDSQKGLFSMKARGENYMRFRERKKIGAPWAYQEMLGLRISPDRKRMEIDNLRSAHGFGPN